MGYHEVMLATSPRQCFASTVTNAVVRERCPNGCSRLQPNRGYFDSHLEIIGRTDFTDDLRRDFNLTCGDANAR